MKETIEDYAIEKIFPIDRVERCGFAMGIKKIHTNDGTIVVVTIFNNKEVYDEICALPYTIKAMNRKHEDSDYDIWTAAFICRMNTETYVPEITSHAMLNSLWVYTNNPPLSFKEYYQNRIRWESAP